MRSKQIQLNRGKAGTYSRLSKDDERFGESMSIENQKLILKKYVEEQGWELVEEYEDDGYTGTNFNRPGIQRLLEDVKAGRIDTVIVKDLSRFGRNYIEVGQYIDYLFPNYGIRFLSLQENIDTDNRESSEMEMMPITNVFNEWHASTTSKKTRAVFEAKARSGRYQAWTAPYGYVIGANENRLPEVDEPAAGVVRKIFEMRSRGISPNKIAQALNAERIPIPTDYKAKKFGKVIRKQTRHMWSPEPIREILHNPLYLGNLVQRRETTVSYKNKKKVYRPESEWIVKENTHEAIVSRELWDKCREMEESVSQGKSTKEGVTLPLSGLLYCEDCGAKMQFSRCRKALKNRTGEKPYYLCERYLCGTYSRIGKGCCTSHGIHRKEIESLLLQDIRAKASLVLKDEERARNDFLNQKERLRVDERNRDKRNLQSKRKRLMELEKLIQSVYEDRVLKKLPEETCFDLLDKYQEEKTVLRSEIAEIETRLTVAERDKKDVEEFIRRIKNYMDVKELTREMCLELIEYITIDKFVNGSDKPRQIHIYYKLVDKQAKQFKQKKEQTL